MARSYVGQSACTVIAEQAGGGKQYRVAHYGGRVYRLEVRKDDGFFHSLGQFPSGRKATKCMTTTADFMERGRQLARSGR